MSYFGIVLLAWGIFGLIIHEFRREEYELEKKSGDPMARVDIALVSTWGSIIVGLIMLMTGDWDCS